MAAGFSMLNELKLEEREYTLLAGLIHEKSGIHLGDNKKELLKARLIKRLRALGFQSFRAYYEYVSGGQANGEVGEMINAISTNVTSFFRENRHFEYLRHNVLPELDTRGGKKKIRLWSAACATGEEAYSLMITVLESLDCAGRDVKMLANDISTRALQTARAGRYPPDKVDCVPGLLAEKYFDHLPGAPRGALEVKGFVKNYIAFRHLNLLVDRLPFGGKFDVIFCRNLMIYFDPPTQEKLVRTLAGALSPGGHLFIGHSENIPVSARENLRVVLPAVFRKV